MLSKDTLMVAIPVYGAFEYVAKAVRSALDHTRSPVFVFILDDNSPGWPKNKKPPAVLQKVIDADPKQVAVTAFHNHQGLLAMWNTAMRAARHLNIETICLANSDVIFTPDWDIPLRRAVERDDYALVGPITNAPGTEEAQDVTGHCLDYKLTDDPNYLGELAAQLYDEHGDQVVPGSINGFCMLGRTEVFWANSYGHDDVFNPINHTNSKGEPNQTPLMTLGEYEYQARLRRRGHKTGFCPGSFVLHYRAVSRGDKHKRGKWLRMGR